MRKIVYFLFSFVIMFFTLNLISASGCCENTCTVVNFEFQCSGNFNPGVQDCNLVTGCQSGTCFSPDSGMCDPSTPVNVCIASGGEPVATDDQRCQMGCCDSLGRNTDWMTRAQCITQSETVGKTPLFDTTKTEEQCKYGNLEQGACIFSTGEFGANCIRDTEEECVSSGGEFYNGDLCSKHELETGCKAQDHLSCSAEQGSGIYWIDSCQQLENIYLGNDPQSKRESNHSGKIMNVIQEEQSQCRSGKDCGKCIDGENICGTTADAGKKVKADNFYCRSTSCADPNFLYTT